MDNIFELARRLEEKIAELPEEQTSQRTRLQMKLEELRGAMGHGSGPSGYETNVVTSGLLARMTEPVREFQKRDIFAPLHEYVYGTERGRVCVIYGLRRTGKTTMIFQALAEMTDEDFRRAAYIKLRRSDTMAHLTRDLYRLADEGFRYIFLDEVTLMADFIDSAAIFPDIFAQMGIKIVLSGTDSLGFWLAEDDELYDRARLVHTTYIPFREYSRLLGISSIDEYIRYGGTFRAGELDFDNMELTHGDASFRDDESTRRYIDTAICRNIQHSLACFRGGTEFRHLTSLYEAGELTNAINRVIEDMNHRFLLSVLTKDFVSGDLGIAARNLRGERDPEKRTDVLDYVDRETVTRRLMDILDIRNREELAIGMTSSHIAEIKQYLHALDLTVDCPVEYAGAGIEPTENVLFSQPGMRYCQAQALVHSLMKDELFAMLPEQDKGFVAERILEQVRGRMLEEIILLETLKSAPKNLKVFKLIFPRGEFDMALHDTETNRCVVFEIKHSDKAIPEQARHLLDEEKCRQTEQRFGKIAAKCVLYQGEDHVSEAGILYRNAADYLCGLPSIQYVFDRELSEDQDIGMLEFSQ